MSKPRYRWWGYIKNVIRAYPGLKAEYADLHEPPITASISGMPGGGNISNPTAQAALRELPKAEQEELNAVTSAIKFTSQLKTGTDRLKLIDLVFWKKSHTLSGAAVKLSISYDTAIDYHGDFILLTAYFLKRIDADGLKNYQKIALKSQKGVLR